MNRRFLSNLRLLQSTHPREAFFLSDMEKGIFEDSKSFPDFNEEADLLIVYGVGEGNLYLSLLPWLKKKRKRKLIFLEDQEIPIRNLLETEAGSKLLRDKRVSLFLFHGIEDELHPFNALMWSLYGKSLAFLSHPQASKDVFEALKERLVFDQKRLDLFLQEYLTYGLRYYQNFYNNLSSLATSFNGEALFNKFKGVPAIVVGAGPSLDKNVSLLKEVGDKGLIFGGGSSLLALLQRGIEPHFSASIDPNPAQGARMERSKAFEGPFFYRLRVFPDVLHFLKGPKLYIPGSGGFDTATWLEKELGIEGKEIEEGHNVVAFLIAIANEMGCNPIVTVGLDLGFPDGKIYAKGIEEGKVPEEAIEKTDIYGMPYLTKWMWVQESEWLSRFQQEHEETKLINATEGGLGAAGVENLTLKEVMERYFEREPFKIPKFESLKISEKSLQKPLEKLYKSLYECREILPSIDETPQGVLKDHALREEPAYEAVLSMFDQVITFLGRKDRLHFLMTIVETQLYMFRNILKFD